MLMPLLMYTKRGCTLLFVLLIKYASVKFHKFTGYEECFELPTVAVLTSLQERFQV